MGLLQEQLLLTEEVAIASTPVVLRQVLSSFELALNFRSSCHHLPIAEITGTCPQAWLRLSIFK